MTRVINRWGTIVSVTVLAIMCLAGPAVAMPSAAGHCAGPECEAAVRCPDVLPSTASVPAPVRADFPAGLLFAVDDVPRPGISSVVAESDAPTLAYRSSGPLASRSPPSLL